MNRRLYTWGLLLVVVVGVVLLFWAPGEAKVCAHALSLIPRDHPVRPTEQDCLGILRTQAHVEAPWTYAWHRHCYASARDMYAFHDCGGELAHLPE